MSNDSFTSKDNFKKGTIVEDVKERLMWVVANEPCEFNGRFYVPSVLIIFLIFGIIQLKNLELFSK